MMVYFIVLDIYCICFGKKWNISMPKLMTAWWLGHLGWAHYFNQNWLFEPQNGAL
jgi:hypothetical protein